MRGDSLRVSRTIRAESLDAVLPRLLDEVLDAVDTAVIVASAEGRVELWNDAAERLYGWSAAEAMGESLGELLVPVSEQAEGEAIFEGVRNGDGWKGTFLCRRRDGSLVPVQVTDVPVVDDHGVVRAIVGISRDVTDRLDADRNARTLQALAHSSQDAVLTVTSGRITTWSASAQRLLGWAADDVVGRDITVLVPEDRRAEAASIIARVAAGERVDAIDTERLTKDGTRLAVVVSVHPVFDVASQAWVGVVTMRDGRTRDEILEAAAMADMRTKLLLAQATETVLILNADFTLRVATPEMGPALGYLPEELVGNPGNQIMHPDDVPAARAAFERALSREEEFPTVTYRRQTASGEWRWAEATLSNRLDDPIVAGIVANVRDVTEREHALAEVVEREALLSAVIGRSSDVAMFFDRDGTIRWVSPAISDALGMDPEALLGTNAIDLVHPDDRAEAMRTFVDWVAEPSDRVRVECRFVDATGRVRWVEQVATDLVDDPSVGYVVANLRDVTDRRLAHDELARLAHVDGLTGLPNRNALQELATVALARSDGRCCAIVFFDLDDFSDVNDALGHVAGDEVLIGVARRVEAVLPDNATLTRFGGDQFAVLCDGVADLPETLAISGLVQSALSAPFIVDHNEVFAVVSSGLALSPPDDVDMLLRRADVALHRAKKAGRGQTVVFEREQGVESLQRLHYAGELRRALARGEIVAHYQPIVDLVTGRTVSVEALARWDHPELGNIPPDVFIPVAESTGLVAELGDRILDQACADVAAWEAAGRRLRVAVNASAVQLMDPAFPARVGAALELHGLDACHLAIEVTETAALRDLVVASQTLGALRDRGIELALDDFGTGYSSLSLLKRLPVGALKVDRSFVSGLGESPEDEQIVNGVIALALALGFRVVGEGVETSRQAALLRAAGCTFGQGYLWSPAVPPDQLLDALARFEPCS